MTSLFLLIAALASQQPGQGASGPEPRPLHMAVDRAFTAQQLYANCLADNALRIGADTSVNARRIVRIAQRSCRSEARALDDVHRAMQAAEGRPQRGAGAVLLRQIAREAADRLIFERSGRPLSRSGTNACAAAFPVRLPPSPSPWLRR